MDLNQYKQLNNDEKKQVWASLEAVPAFKLLKEIFYKQTRVSARPTTQDGKEAFHYEAIRAQAIMDVLMYPADQIGERKKYDSGSPAQSLTIE